MARKSLKTSTAMLMCCALALPNGVIAQEISAEEFDRICGDIEAREACAENLQAMLSDGSLILDGEGNVDTELDVASDGSLTIPGVVSGGLAGALDTETEQAGEISDSSVTAEAGAEETPVLEDAETETAIEGDVSTEAATLDEDQDQPVETSEDGTVTETTGVTIEADTNETDTALDNGDVVEPVVEGAKTVEVTPEQTESVEETEVAVDDAVDSEAETVAEAEPEVAQEDTAESAAAANETPEVAATAEIEAETTDEDAETVVIGETDVRSSAEDFDTSVSASASNGDDNDNLEKFAKIALGVAGAAALSKIIGDNEQVVSNSGDRIVVEQDGEYRVLKNDDVLLRRPGVEVATKSYDDGSTRTIVTRQNGVRVITIRAADGQVLRRARILPDGTEIVLFDDTQTVDPVDLAELPLRADSSVTDVSDLRAALAATEARNFDRRFTLQQVREIRAVRELVPVIELQAVNFDTGSAAIRASEAEELRDLGVTMRDLIELNPNEVFLVEGHTDAVGRASYNLALSDRRAESVALALTEYFDVPPESMIVQGYGESNLKVPTLDAERQNRRATVRRITPLLQSANLN